MSPPKAGYLAPIPTNNGWIDMVKVLFEEVIEMEGLMTSY